MDLEVATRSMVGAGRTVNEDAFLCDSDLRLFAVAAGEGPCQSTRAWRRF